MDLMKLVPFYTRIVFCTTLFIIAAVKHYTTPLYQLKCDKADSCKHEQYYDFDLRGISITFPLLTIAVFIFGNMRASKYGKGFYSLLHMVGIVLLRIMFVVVGLVLSGVRDYHLVVLSIGAVGVIHLLLGVIQSMIFAPQVDDGTVIIAEAVTFCSGCFVFIPLIQMANLNKYGDDANQSKIGLIIMQMICFYLRWGVHMLYSYWLDKQTNKNIEWLDLLLDVLDLIETFIGIIIMAV